MHGDIHGKVIEQEINETNFKRIGLEIREKILVRKSAKICNQNWAK